MSEATIKKYLTVQSEGTCQVSRKWIITAFDHDKDAQTTHLFFQTVQNKMHYAMVKQQNVKLAHRKYIG